MRAQVAGMPGMGRPVSGLEGGGQLPAAQEKAGRAAHDGGHRQEQSLFACVQVLSDVALGDQ